MGGRFYMIIRDSARQILSFLHNVIPQGWIPEYSLHLRLNDLFGLRYYSKKIPLKNFLAYFRYQRQFSLLDLAYGIWSYGSMKPFYLQGIGRIIGHHADKFP